MNKVNRLKTLVTKIMTIFLKCLEFRTREDREYTQLIQILEKFGLKTKKVTFSLYTRVEIQQKKCQLVLILIRWQKVLNIKNQILLEFKMENLLKINVNSCPHQNQWLILVYSSLKVMDPVLSFSIWLNFSMCFVPIKKKLI